MPRICVCVYIYIYVYLFSMTAVSPKSPQARRGGRARGPDDGGRFDGLLEGLLLLLLQFKGFSDFPRKPLGFPFDGVL